jgi:dTDP-4-dehydrorhamnose 3,5-epimerase
MKLIHTSLPGIFVIEPEIYQDQRGFFLESFHSRHYQENGISDHFVQDNHSGSHKGVLRGLHYQIQQPQGKLVRVIAGEIFDVAVDIRRSSTTFGKWEGVRLSAQNRLQMWVPVGFAHGFSVLSEWAEVLYKATDYYAPEYERTILWDDPEIGIQWPLLDGQLPILSPKDAQGAPLHLAEVFD